jgi:hypothetical protein
MVHFAHGRKFANNGSGSHDLLSLKGKHGLVRLQQQTHAAK